MKTLVLYTPTKERSFELKPLSIGLIITAVLFVSFPLLHVVTNSIRIIPIPPVPTFALNPPDLIIDLPKPPEPPKDDVDDPELIEDQPDMFIPPLPHGLTPGDNGAYISNTTKNLINDIGGDTRTFLLSQLEKQPRALIAISPIAPYQMKNISGKVIVEFIILPNGGVSDVRIKTSTHREFNDAAITAVKKSKWSPGEVKGEAVRTLVNLPILFR